MFISKETRRICVLFAVERNKIVETKAYCVHFYGRNTPFHLYF